MTQTPQTISETDRLNTEAMLTAMAAALERSNQGLDDLGAAIAPAFDAPEDRAQAAAAMAELLSAAYREHAGGDAPAAKAGAGVRDLSLLPQVLQAVQPDLLFVLIGVVAVIYRKNIGGLLDRLREVGVKVTHEKTVIEIAAKFGAQAEVAETAIAKREGEPGH